MHFHIRIYDSVMMVTDEPAASGDSGGPMLRSPLSLGGTSAVLERAPGTWRYSGGKAGLARCRPVGGSPSGGSAGNRYCARFCSPHSLALRALIVAGYLLTQPGSSSCRTQEVW